MHSAKLNPDSARKAFQVPACKHRQYHTGNGGLMLAFVLNSIGLGADLIRNKRGIGFLRSVP